MAQYQSWKEHWGVQISSWKIDIICFRGDLDFPFKPFAKKKKIPKYGLPAASSHRLSAIFALLLNTHTRPCGSNMGSLPDPIVTVNTQGLVVPPEEYRLNCSYILTTCNMWTKFDPSNVSCPRREHKALRWKEGKIPVCGFPLITITLCVNYVQSILTAEVAWPSVLQTIWG